MENKKQIIIEDKIDTYANTEMGKDMIAMIALNSRITVSKWKETQFLKEFSEDLGFKKHIDTAVRILNYLYPRNSRHTWDIWDKMYEKRVKNSAWIKYNLKNS